MGLEVNLTSDGSPADVFISCAQDADGPTALEIADRLEAAGVKVWIATRSIEGAQNYADEIVAAIDRCKVVAVLCSEASMESRHVAIELDLAFEAGRPRLPLLLEKTTFPGQVRYWLAGANHIDASGPVESWLPAMLRALKRLGVECADHALLESASPTSAEPVEPMVRRSRQKADTRGNGSPASNVREVIAGYRTADTPSGFFRTPGEIHAHIDGARDIDGVTALIRELGEGAGSRFPGKLNRIIRFSGGPQRDDRAFAETYRYHTPGSVQQEAFDSFSTVWLGRAGELAADAVAALARVLASISEQPEAVVELERVIGVLDDDGWQEVTPNRVADPRSLEAPELAEFRRLTTSPIEIHHSIDFRRSSDDHEPLVSVDDLPTWPNLGGWFLFDKGTSWSYRSSEFVGRTGEYHYAACVGQKRLSDFLEEYGYPYELRTLVEQVLGIWRGGAQPHETRLSVPDLGQWELSCPRDGHVWVIAANFLGDSSPDVQRAMLQNLGQNVTYTYFLHTHADVLRLGLLASQLERALVNSGSAADTAHRTVNENVRCVLLPSGFALDDRLRRLLAADYFLCPHDARMGGYRLDSSGLSGERVSDEDLAYLVSALDPLLEAKVRGLFLSSEESWAPRSSFQAVVCTDLEQTAAEQDQEPWLKMLAAYDRIVAREVSMHGGECLVVRPVRNGYLVVFAQPREAAAWAKRLQFEVQRFNEEIGTGSSRALAIPTHNIALGYGSVSRVLRAHGHDHIGGSIDDCIDLAARLRGGIIAMSRSFAVQYEDSVGKQEFLTGTSEHSDRDLGGLRLLEWP